VLLELEAYSSLVEDDKQPKKDECNVLGYF
jgi:hypothetical protein